MAWTEASNVLNAAGLPEFLRRDSTSTLPAEEEFLQEIASVIPKNIVAERLKLLQGNNTSDSSSPPEKENNKEPFKTKCSTTPSLPSPSSTFADKKICVSTFLHAYIHTYIDDEMFL